ncbi:MAG: hypothetical protein K9L95_06095 [Candidatus Omnitrophica bacterium]|nr:hypothetical protein [Candidatus Omnitrophota bacterium]MCF7879016.1 hypothetical protein [Candidatus Omnitrophota bacterium]
MSYNSPVEEILIYFLDKKELSYKIRKVIENINFFIKGGSDEQGTID